MMHESKASGKMETLYDKLNNLAAEISEGIINLSGGRREEVQRQLSELREQAYRERSPEAVYNTVLFRKYAEIANQIKDSKEGGRTEKATFLGELPSFVYESDDENILVGWEATKANIFRLRTLVVVFALISFSVMSSAPYINEAQFQPKHHFNDGCTYKFGFEGSFNFRAYQLVIAVGVLTFVQNIAHLAYYALPVDSNRQKYLPGGTSVLALCFREPGSAETRGNAIATFFRVHWKFLEVTLDSVHLVMSAIAFVVSQYILESAVETQVVFGGTPVTQYYTLSTCYETFSNQSPTCLDEGMNPTSRIRAALAMLFFATFFQLLCFLMSLRTFRQDPGDGLFTLPFGLLDGGSSALGGGGAASEGGGGSSSIPVGDSSSGAHESSSGAYGMRSLASSEVPPGEDEEYGHRAGTKL